MLKRFLGNRKGTAEVIGSVMFVVIIMFFFSSVYLWHDQATRQMNTVAAEKMNSPISVKLDANGLNVSNTGGSTATLTRLWIINDTSTACSTDHAYANLDSLNVQVGVGGSQRIVFSSPTLTNVDGSINAYSDVYTGSVVVNYDLHWLPTVRNVTFEVLTSLGNTAACVYPTDIAQNLTTFVNGTQGTAGPQGPAGPAGPQGDTGATGATGPQGPAGVNGTTPDITGILSGVIGDFLPDYHSIQWAPCSSSGHITGQWDNDWIIPSTISGNIVWRINATYYGGAGGMYIDQNSIFFFNPFAPGQNPGSKAPFLGYIVNYQAPNQVNRYSNAIHVSNQTGENFVTLYFGAVAPGSSQLMTVDDVGYAMLSLTIYGRTPSTYAQSFPLFAVEARVPATLIVTPTNGAAGTSVTATGSNYVPNANMVISYDGATVATTTVTTAGTIPAGVTFTAPASSFGTHVVTATDQYGTAASAGFNINAVQLQPLNPASGPVGTTVTLAGASFTASSTINIRYDGTILSTSPASIVSSPLGAFTATFNVPASTAGSHTVQVTDGANSPTLNFQVTRQATLTPTTGVSGASVTVTGTGYAASSTITVQYDGAGQATIPPTVTTTAAGSFSCTFAVPASAAGAHTVRASDGAGFSTATFTIAPTLTLNPTSANVGSTITVTGTGYAASSAITVKFDGVTQTTTPASVTTGATGSFTCTFTVPASPAGSHTVTTVDAISNTVSAAFTTKSSLTLTPTSGALGSSVSISGSGFAASTPLTFTWDGTALSTTPASLSTSGAGSFTGVSFTVPASTDGSHTVTATEGANPASATFNVPVVAVTVDTNPSGIPGGVIIDGSPVTGPQTFNWVSGSVHAVQTVSSVSGLAGTRYAWLNWSDSAAQTHSYTVPSSAATLTAYYKTQYYLAVNSGGGGAVTGEGWYDKGTSAVFTISPTTVANETAKQYVFSTWVGTGSGSYTGSASSSSVTLNNPVTETANWITQIQVNAKYASIDSSQTTVTLNGTRTGASVSVSLTQANQLVWLDAGTAWVTNSQFPASPTSEQWVAPSDTSGTVSATTAINPTYYHQYKLTLSYSIPNGGSPTAPVFAANRNGAATPQTLTLTATAYWFDAGSTWSISPNPLGGSSSSEQSMTSQTVTGTIAQTQTTAFTYYHQYKLTLSYSVSGAGSPTPPTFTANRFGTSTPQALTTSTVGYWFDAGSTWMVSPNPLGGSTASERWITNQPVTGIVSASGSTAFVYYHQYLMTLSFTAPNPGNPPAPAFTANQYGSLATVTLTTSAVGYWFDAGSTWQVTNPLIGGSHSYTVTPSSGTITAAQTIAFNYV